MRHWAVLLAVLLWVGSAQAEIKRSPDGFGAIKFGMTREEAWAALDGKGEWRHVDDQWGDELLYTTRIAVAYWHTHDFSVITRFVDNVVHVIFVSFSDHLIRASCDKMSAYISGYIKSYYAIEPISRLSRGEILKDHEFHIDYFIFEDSSSISVENLINLDDKDECIIDIAYLPPSRDELPF